MKQLVKEIQSIKSDLSEVKIALNEIDKFQHKEVRPDYLEKLKKLQSMKGRTFDSVQSMDNELQ